jgi:hypothetical protein
MPPRIILSIAVLELAHIIVKFPSENSKLLWGTFCAFLGTIQIKQ